MRRRDSGFLSLQTGSENALSLSTITSGPDMTGPDAQQPGLARRLGTALQFLLLVLRREDRVKILRLT